MVLPAMKKSSAMKAMKKKATSKVARGRFAKALVLRGAKAKTVGGLKASDLMRNKRGKIVSKRRAAFGKRAYQRVEGWVESLMAARKALRLEGFCAINGKTVQGKAFYVKAKSIYVQRNVAQPAVAAAASGEEAE